jgi:hypothetical protein
MVLYITIEIICQQNFYCHPLLQTITNSGRYVTAENNGDGYVYNLFWGGPMKGRKLALNTDQ